MLDEFAKKQFDKNRTQILKDHELNVIISECSECKQPMTELQWYITLEEIPGICPMCMETIIKKSMGIEDEENNWDDYRF